jgi:glycosyltransferase involved in cell wall biosynthesis
MPAVSIIMNISNGAATLCEAIDSALSQTLADWELIVWDDCSIDNGAEIVRSYTDPRIRYFLAPRKTSLGQVRQAAINRAQGEWLAFLDQDDVWLPRKLEKQIALTNSPAVGLVYGRTLAFDSKGSQRDYDTFHEFAPLPEGNILVELVGRGCFVAMVSAMLRRSAVLEAGGIPNHIHIAPDYFLYLAVCTRYEARAVQSVVCRYRLHAGSMTQIYRRQSIQESLCIIDGSRKLVAREVYERRKTRLSTALAVEEMRDRDTFLDGVRRLMRAGSPLWLAGRPFAYLWRRLRRLVRRPYWRSAEGS